MRRLAKILKMGFCCAINCHYYKRRKNGDKLQTFGFPKDPKLLSRWKKEVSVKKIRRDTRVCQLHFHDHCFVTPGQIG